MKIFRFLSFSLVMMSFFISCEQVKKAKMYLLGEGQKSSVSSDTKKTKKNKNKEDQPTQPPEIPTNEKTVDQQNAEKEDPTSDNLLENFKNEKSSKVSSVKQVKEQSIVYEESGPLSAKDHFGGGPTFLSSDTSLIYGGFGRRLNVYDQNLKIKAFVNGQAQIHQVISVIQNGQTNLYLHEAGNILEIVPLVDNKNLKVTKSFQVEGPFDGPFILSKKSQTTEASQKQEVLLYVFLSDRIQLLDLAQPDQVNVFFELPLKEASQVFPLDDLLYIANGQELTVIDSNDMSTLASVPIGNYFEILGVFTEKETRYLLLALKPSKTDLWRSLQLMPLVSHGRGIASIGETVVLKQGIEQAIMSQDQKALYFLNQGVLSVFDMGQRKELQGYNRPFEKILFVTGPKSQTMMASPNEFGVYSYEDMASLLPQDASSSPTAEGQALSLGSQAGYIAEYKWNQTLKISLAHHITKIFLFGRSLLMVTNNVDGLKNQDPLLYYSEDFSTGPTELFPLSLPNNDPLSLVYPGSNGLFLYQKDVGSLYWADPKKHTVTPIDLAKQLFVGMDSLVGQNERHLYLAVDPKEGQGERGLNVFKIDAASLVTAEGNLKLSQVGGLKILKKKSQILMACGSLGACLIDLSQGPQAMKVLYKVPSQKKDGLAREVVVSPDEKIGFILYEHKSGPFISLISLKPDEPYEASVISGLSFSNEQFRGLTFIHSGQYMLLPHDYGVSIFDITNPKKPNLFYKWKLGKSYQADVMDQGKTVCVALGERGVECAAVVEQVEDQTTQVQGEQPIQGSSQINPQ